MEMALWLLVWGKMELGMLVEIDGCFDANEAHAVVGLAPPEDPACLTLDELAARWGVVFEKDDVDATIGVISGAARLPAVQARLRATTWAAMGQRVDPEVVEEVQAAASARPSMTLRGNVDTGAGTGRQTLGLRTAVGPGTWDLELVDTTDEGLERVRSSWTSVGSSHRATLGDTNIQSNHLTGHYEGRGARVRLGDQSRRAHLFTRDLAGERPGEDWQVELYANGVLLDYLPAGELDWAFDDVPQPAAIEVRFYGPAGEEIIEKYGSRARSLLAPGRVAADLEMIQVGQHVLQDEDAVTGPDDGDVAMRAEGRAGLAPGVEGSISYRRLPGGQRLTGAGLRLPSVGVEAVRDDQGRVALLADGRLGSLRLQHQQRPDGFNAARKRGLSSSTAVSYRATAQQVHLRPSLEREIWHNGRETWDLGLDATTYQGRYTFRLDTDLRHDNAGWAAPRLRPAIRWRGDTTELVGSGHVHSLDPSNASFNGSLRHRLNDTETFALSGSSSLAAARWSLAPSLSSMGADGWRVSLAAPVNSEGSYGLTLSFSTTIGFDDTWAPRVDPKSAKAFVSVLVFEDLDGDGTRDRGERGIPGVSVRGLGETDAAGFAKAWLSPGREIIVDLGVDELDDPRHYGTGALAFTIRPGAFNSVEYPVEFISLDRS